MTCPHCDDKLREAMEALEPFAKAGMLFEGDPGETDFDQCIYKPAAGPEYSLCGDDLRRARATLRKLKGEE